MSLRPAVLVPMLLVLGSLNPGIPQASAAAQPSQTFTVTNTSDSGAGSLRQAILSANADSVKNPNAIDAINFNLGMGVHTISLSSAVLNVTAKDLTISSPDPNDVTINGNNNVQDFTIAAGAKVTISGLTVTGGSSFNGGGLLNNGTLTLTNDIFSNNTASNAGGGVYNNGTLTVNSSTFTNNSAPNSPGLNEGGGIANAGTLTVNGSTFTKNQASFGGGGIAQIGTAKLTLTNSVFNGNMTNGEGGGILNGDASTATASNTTFTSNDSFIGGAIYNLTATGAVLNVSGLIFSGNTSYPRTNGADDNNIVYGFGGTITVDSLQDTNDGNLSAGHISLRKAITSASPYDTINFAPSLVGQTIPLTLGELDITTNLTIQGPAAGQITINTNHSSRAFSVGAGIKVTISNLTITNGFNNNYGGAISNDGTLTLNKDNITDSVAGLGGGAVFNDGTLNITNSVISGNTGGNGGGLDNISGTVMTKAKGFNSFNVASKWQRKIKGVAPKEGWFTLTNLATLSAAITADKSRFDIEEMFRDFKSGGYNLEDTSVAGKRLISLIILTAIAYTSARIQGQEIKRKGVQKYVGRLQEPGRLDRRHSSFYIGLYGQNWVNFVEPCRQLVTH